MPVTLVTGATGLVGNAVVRELLARKRSVRALVRSPERAAKIVPAGCEIVAGDVTDSRSLEATMKDCDCVYHAAGLPEQWLKDPATFERVNVEGTRNVLTAASKARVRRFVYTSTIDVFAMRPGVEFDETVLDPSPKHTYYERSKQKADALVTRALADGLPAVFLHPSGVYGPGPASSPGLNRAIAQLVRSEVPLLLPGSVPLVYVDDIGSGHVLAEEKGEIGERFILHESPQTLRQVVLAVREIAPEAKLPRTMPAWCARTFASVGEAVAGVVGRPPILARGQVAFLESICAAKCGSGQAAPRLEAPRLSRGPHQDDPVAPRYRRATKVTLTRAPSRTWLGCKILPLSGEEEHTPCAKQSSSMPYERRWAAVRRPGAWLGHPVDLAAETLRALVDRTGIDPALIEDVIMGCVSQVGDQSLNVARNAALAAGFPDTVAGTSVDRQCGSSQQARTSPRRA